MGTEAQQYRQYCGRDHATGDRVYAIIYNLCIEIWEYASYYFTLHLSLVFTTAVYYNNIHKYQKSVRGGTI